MGNLFLVCIKIIIAEESGKQKGMQFLGDFGRSLFSIPSSIRLGLYAERLFFDNPKIFGSCSTEWGTWIADTNHVTHLGVLGEMYKDVDTF